MTDQGVHDPATEGEAGIASALNAPPADAQMADQAATSEPDAASAATNQVVEDTEAAEAGTVGPNDLSEVASETEPDLLTAEVEDEDEEVADEPSATDEAAAPAEDVDVPAEEVKNWYILKVQVNREDSIRDALVRRMKILGLEQYFGEIVVPTEDVAEFNKSGKRRIVKRKLYPGYLLVNMAINDETWFLIRETPGVGDFTGSAGRPTPMETRDVERILRLGATEDDGGTQVKTAIPFSSGDRVRVKDGYFQNFEGEVAAIDHANGRITVMINIFGRSTPVELEHWQVEAV